MTTKSVSQIISEQLRSDQAVVSAYFASNGYRIPGDRDRRLIMGDQSVPQLNSTSTVDHWFRLDKYGDSVYANLKLVLGVGPVSATGGTYARLCDCAGIFLIERIQVWYDGKQISDVHSDAIYSRYFQDNTGAERELLFRAIGSGSEADRDTAAAGNQTFVLDLDEIFSYWNMILPRNIMTNDDFRVMVRFRGINDVVETDGTAPSFAITNCKLGLSLVRSNPQLNAILTEGMNNGFGLPFHQIEPIIITKQETSALSTQIDLPVLRDKDVVSMDFFCRSATDLADNKYTTFADVIADYSMESANTYTHGAQFPIDRDLYTKLILPNYNIAAMDQLMDSRLWVCSFSASLEDQWSEGEQIYAGSKYFTQGDNKLTINYNAPFTGTLTLIIWRTKATFVSRGKLVSGH